MFGFRRFLRQNESAIFDVGILSQVRRVTADASCTLCRSKVRIFRDTFALGKDHQMNCLRCHGLMVATKLEDAEGSSRCSSGWQCLLCGEITDAVIAANRKGRQEPRRYEPRLQGHVNRTV